MITAIDLANAFVDGYAKSDYLTNMKLNKLVYFAYARYLKKGRFYSPNLFKHGNLDQLFRMFIMLIKNMAETKLHNH